MAMAIVQLLETHWAVVAQTALGLDFYASGRYEQAIELFDAAITEAGVWGSQSGTENLYLYLANAQGRNSDSEAYHDTFLRAVEQNPQFARAHVGVAESIFQSSQNGCGDQVDQSGVESAISTIQTAQDPSFELPLTEFQQANSSLLLGRMRLCLYLAGLESESAVEAELRAVLAMLDDLRTTEIRERSRLENVAAEAWAALAVLVTISGSSDSALEAQYYGEAISPSAVSSRKALFHLNLASAVLKTQACEEARAEVDNGLALFRSPNQGFVARFDSLNQQWSSTGCAGSLPELAA